MRLLPEPGPLRRLAFVTFVDSVGTGMFLTVSVLYFTGVAGFSVTSVAVGLSLLAGPADRVRARALACARTRRCPNTSGPTSGCRAGGWSSPSTSTVCRRARVQLDLVFNERLPEEPVTVAVPPLGTRVLAASPRLSRHHVARRRP